MLGVDVCGTGRIALASWDLASRRCVCPHAWTEGWTGPCAEAAGVLCLSGERVSHCTTSAFAGSVRVREQHVRMCSAWSCVVCAQ
eukprot:6935132-Prymnesium_polylepis.1